MAFDTAAWLLWMWLTVGLYWLTPREARLWLLAILTLAFLVVLSPLSAVILSAFTVLVAIVARRPDVTGLQTVAAAGGFVLVLAAFKVKLAWEGGLAAGAFLLPLGISYYCFRCMHVVIERYKGQLPPVAARDLIGYLFFLPTIVTGPIHRIDDWLHDNRRQRFDPALLAEGAERVLYGYAKIVILGNWLVSGQMGAAIAALPDQEGPLATYLTIAKSGLNVYFQFSGYSDIAIGFARMLGYRVIENFNWPYLQPNISAFWRSWHISLTQWCRDYLYGPVVSLTRAPAIAAMTVMVVIGLWHEITLRFLLWGVWHGTGLIVWQWWDRHGPPLPEGLPRWARGGIHVLKVLATVHFFWFSIVLLEAPTIGEALRIYARFLPF
jgi:alginate O-acetyltransferase complex protein AlgI